ncbi:unnamed protein product [Caenorhabditis auriculariae]|uniref:Nucleotide-diphospho-sugar transferase domain-containing protein n=1 Tax=Caenorhabditis auriculariae TaxID=2777116 RepID=A0A8S1H1B8_9PELO|nr:unnamed protein product [Caenorhabditis auriculariae]
MRTRSAVLLALFAARFCYVTFHQQQPRHVSRRFHNGDFDSSLFVLLQSTSPEKTSLCEGSWLTDVDDLFVFPQRIDLRRIRAASCFMFTRMLAYSSKYLPGHSRWILFSLDDAYVLVDKLRKELSALDSHEPQFAVLADVSLEDWRRNQNQGILMSRAAHDILWDRLRNSLCHCDVSVNNFISQCLGTKGLNFNEDAYGKSRNFALTRHFEVNEMSSASKPYNDGEEWISGHSSSILSFLSLSADDLRVLRVLFRRVRVSDL